MTRRPKLRRPKPRQVLIGGVAHVLVIFQLLEKHPDGAPKTLGALYDEDQVRLSGGEEFISAYVQERFAKSTGRVLLSFAALPDKL